MASRTRKPAQPAVTDEQVLNEMAEESAEENPLDGATLWRVQMPARGTFKATTIGIYVNDDVVVGTLGGANWALWQPWNRTVKPWLAKRGGKGTVLAPGERLEL